MYLALMQAVEDDDNVSIDRGDLWLVVVILLIVVLVLTAVYYWQHINRGP